MSAFRLTPSTGTLGPDPRQAVHSVTEAVGEIILGKDRAVRLALACLLARGHLLIEDMPGVGKTTLAQVLATVLGLSFRRIQFTSDLLPADILGVSIYDRERGEFEFHPGPVFAQVVLADEVNRATPKTQSALLEAMEEGQVTQDGETRVLPRPFFVIATQNPARQVGTFALPESQLDRFLMRIELGYPDRAAERALLRGRDRREMLRAMGPAIDPGTLLALQAQVPGVHASEPLLDYVQALTDHTRTAAELETGISPRAAISLLRAAQAWALVDDRGHVLPEDVQAVACAVVAHRLRPASGDEHGGAAAFCEDMLRRVPVP